MDAALAKAIDNSNGGLVARQVLLPDSVRPRLDETMLPRVRLSDPDLMQSILDDRNKHVDQKPRTSGRRVLHATGTTAAQLLMSPSRDASIFGPTLGKAHRNIGRYLATEHLSHVLGLEEYRIRHVQGHEISGHRLKDESQTAIIAMMRGGLGLAEGIFNVFPSTSFVHAHSASGIQPQDLQGRSAVVLVDSVVNTGSSLLEHLQRVRQLSPKTCIVVVAGVVQAKTLDDGHALALALDQYDVRRLIMLRRSDNEFKGSKATDTGNRLFNTTHLD
ncbi:hypothetical protein CDD83_10408 [Cordyceps sp. RAO-2017]|nr:hypothetical protein CDD83_10408 [Cordyceps sp. RAO-2017]